MSRELAEPNVATDSSSVWRGPTHELETLVGKSFECRAPFPLLAFFFAMIASVMLLSAALIGLADLALGALLPLGWFLALLMFRPASCTLTIGQLGVEVDVPPTQIAYEDMQVVLWDGKARLPEDRPLGPGRLAIIHRGGVLDLPRLKTTSARMHDLYQLLWSYVERSGSRDVHPKLLRYLIEQEALYGADSVYAFVARRHRAQRMPLRTLQAWMAATSIVGLVWLLLGAFVGAHPGFATAGLILAGTGLLGWLTSFAVSRPSLLYGQDISDASMVVSPGGMALVQGSLEGSMPWHELQSMHGPDLLHALFAVPLVRLTVRGASIPIADIYDRPLVIIARTIYGYWRRKRLNQG